MRVSEPTNYQKVIDILDDSIGGSEVEIGAHGAFWRDLTKDEFVEHTLPGFNVKIIEVGDPENSNLIRALRGVNPFDDSIFSRMPFRMEAISEEKVNFIASWISDGCY